MILSCTHINKSYSNGLNRLLVLKDISLELKEGEIVSIMGSSGSGKSTLLNILGTLDLPDSGIVKINGKDVSKISEKATAQLRNKELGFVFQFHHLLPEFTAFENVLIPSLIGGTSQEVRSRALELFGLMNLTERMTHYPQQLSGGERQRVAIMRALIQEPALVLADEPTGNLDKANTKILLDLIIKISDEFKQTFLIATHDTMVSQIAHRRFCLIDCTLNVMDNL